MAQWMLGTVSPIAPSFALTTSIRPPPASIPADCWGRWLSADTELRALFHRFPLLSGLPWCVIGHWQPAVPHVLTAHRCESCGASEHSRMQEMGLVLGEV